MMVHIRDGQPGLPLCRTNQAYYTRDLAEWERISAHLKCKRCAKLKIRKDTANLIGPATSQMIRAIGRTSNTDS